MGSAVREAGSVVVTAAGVTAVEQVEQVVEAAKVALPAELVVKAAAEGRAHTCRGNPYRDSLQDPRPWPFPPRRLCTMEFASTNTRRVHPVGSFRLEFQRLSARQLLGGQQGTRPPRESARDPSDRASTTKLNLRLAPDSGSVLGRALRIGARCRTKNTDLAWLARSPNCRIDIFSHLLLVTKRTGIA